MVGESIAIVSVLAVTAVMAVRSGKRQLAWLTLPFLCVPVCVLIGEVILFYFRHSIGLRYSSVQLVSVLAGAALGGAVSIMAGNSIRLSRVRTAYMVVGLLFSVILALAYIMPILD